MSDTAQTIIDVMEELIETRGYNAISYQDIADQVGIRKASIHHHFPSKADLGAAVVKRYADNLNAIMDEARRSGDARQALETYFIPYKKFAEDGTRICLCGALAGELLALPEDMRDLVAAFFESHQRWLEELIAFGAGQGVFTIATPAKQLARQIFTALQGALMVRRAIGDVTEMTDVIAAVQQSLGVSEA